MGYVDDTKTFIAIPPRDLSNGNAISDLNEDLNEISRWCCANSLLSNKSGKNEGSSDLGLRSRN